mmetsp:Transcript_11697/g.37138  ORF Transcript_11697/g.37138 Transcript_11697/m.37138 type:complete len:271 (+) Transcript_11697:362-1174(+)
MAEKGCATVLTTLLRRPEKQTLSFFMHFGVQEMSDKPKVYGSSFTSWVAERPNIQSRKIMGSQNRNGVDWDLRNRDRIARVINSFDLVGLTERFNEYLIMLAHRFGEEDIRYTSSDPNHHKPGGKTSVKYENGVAVENTIASTDRFAKVLGTDKDRWKPENLQPGEKEALAAATVVDRELYAAQKARFEAEVEAAGPWLASALEAAAAASVNTWFGGQVGVARYKWVPTVDMDAPGPIRRWYDYYGKNMTMIPNPNWREEDEIPFRGHAA